MVLIDEFCYATVGELELRIVITNCKLFRQSYNRTEDDGVVKYAYYASGEKEKVNGLYIAWSVAF